MTPAAAMRLAEWHAFEALKCERQGRHHDAAESLQSAREWLQNAGLPVLGITDASEVHGLVARARTGVLE